MKIPGAPLTGSFLLPKYSLYEGKEKTEGWRPAVFLLQLVFGCDGSVWGQEQPQERPPVPTNGEATTAARRSLHGCSSSCITKVGKTRRLRNRIRIHSTGGNFAAGRSKGTGTPDHVARKGGLHPLQRTSHVNEGLSLHQSQHFLLSAYHSGPLLDDKRCAPHPLSLLDENASRITKTSPRLVQKDWCKQKQSFQPEPCPCEQKQSAREEHCVIFLRL